MTRRAFDRLLARRFTWTVALSLVTLGAGYLVATRLRPDFSIESFFPNRDASRTTYERYRNDFPHDDARALVLVEAPDLFTREGLARVARLEQDLAQIAGVIDTDGLTTTLDVTATPSPAADGDGNADGEDVLTTERLFRRTDLTPDAIAERRARAVTDPLFRWTLVEPNGNATTIRVNLEPDVARSDLGRAAFLTALRATLARHEHPGQTLTMGGLPATRARYAELIGEDMGVLLPLALLVTTALLWLSFRSAAAVAASLLTIVVATIWTLAVSAALGYPMHLLTQLVPIVVMIISVSDTVHIVQSYHAEMRQGAPPLAAIAHATHESALPCLLTELVIGLGFLGLVFQDIGMISEFGIVTAAGMALVWCANVTVLPLALAFLRPRAAAPTTGAAGPLGRAIDRLVAACDRIGQRRPGRVAIGGALVVVTALALAPQVGREYYAFDDLAPDLPLAQDIRTVERLHGGSVPLAVLVERGPDTDPGDEPMLEPAALALTGRIASFLEDRLEIPQATSAADVAAKVHALWVGEERARAEPLPPTRGAAAQELLWLDRKLLRDVLSHDLERAAVIAMVPDHGSTRVAGMLDELRLFLAAESAATGYALHVTGSLAMADAVYQSLVGGLAASLGFAIVISLLVFALVLRSWRLGLIALVPNVLPLFLTVAVMAALGIDLKPSTVVIFSVTLVIADDDTIQFLVRYRRRFLARSAAPAADAAACAAIAAAPGGLHGVVATETLEESGRAMLLTALSISAGFFTLLASRFTGLQHLGLLIGVSLFTAVFADLFLSPLLLRALRPRIGPALARGASPERPTPDHGSEPCT